MRREVAEFSHRIRARSLALAAFLSFCLVARSGAVPDGDSPGATAAVQDTTAVAPLTAWVGARVYPVAADPIDDAVIVTRAGKIVDVGPRETTPIPPGSDVKSLAGRVVIPGLVDFSTSVPLDSSSDDDLSIAQYFHAADALDAHHPFSRILLREGITTVGVVPRGRGNVGALGVVVKLGGEPEHPGDTWRLVRPLAYLTVELGQVPGSLGSARTSTADRLGQYYAVRKVFTAAQNYASQWRKYREAVKEYNEKARQWKAARQKKDGKDDTAKKAADKSSEKDSEKQGDKPGEGDSKEPEKRPGSSGAAPGAADDEKEKPAEKKEAPAGDGDKKAQEEKKTEPKPPTPPRAPQRNDSLEALLPALAGELRVLVTAHRRDDIVYALRLKEEFDLDIAILGATEGHRLGAELEAAGVGVAISPVLLRRRGLRFVHHSEATAAELAAAGVPVAISAVETEPLAARLLRWQAAAAMRGGLDVQRALRAITLEPARCLGVAEHVGSLEPGKEADFVVLDGEPLDIEATVVQVVVDGKTRVRREQKF